MQACHCNGLPCFAYVWSSSQKILNHACKECKYITQDLLKLLARSCSGGTWAALQHVSVEKCRNCKTNTRCLTRHAVDLSISQFPLLLLRFIDVILAGWNWNRLYFLTNHPSPQDTKYLPSTLKNWNHSLQEVADLAAKTQFIKQRK